MEGPEWHEEVVQGLDKYKSNVAEMLGFGMWSDLEEMDDSAEYSREIRLPRYKL